jgi:hypothetical protein
MDRKGQQLTEYALILGVVALALAAMQPFMKRGVQATLKLTADELGKCATAEYLNYSGVNITAQKLGQGQMNLYQYTVSRPMKSAGTQQLNTSFNTAGVAMQYNDSNQFSGAWKMNYRLYTSDIAVRPGDTVSNNPNNKPPSSTGGKQ